MKTIENRCARHLYKVLQNSYCTEKQVTVHVQDLRVFLEYAVIYDIKLQPNFI